MELTINYNDIDFDVEFDYTPEEAPVMYYSDGSGYPGCAEEISIYSVKYNDKEFLDLLSDSAISTLEELISKELADNRY